jgi:hypothetical protein
MRVIATSIATVMLSLLPWHGPTLYASEMTSVFDCKVQSTQPGITSVTLHSGERFLEINGSDRIGVEIVLQRYNPLEIEASYNVGRVAAYVAIRDSNGELVTSGIIGDIRFSGTCLSR